MSLDYLLEGGFPRDLGAELKKGVVTDLCFLQAPTPPPRSSRKLRAGTLEALVRHLLDARTSGADVTFTATFLATHRAFTSTPALLGLMADRSGSEGPRVTEVSGLSKARISHQNSQSHWGFGKNGQIESLSHPRLEALEVHPTDELERTKG